MARPQSAAGVNRLSAVFAAPHFYPRTQPPFIYSARRLYSSSGSQKPSKHHRHSQKTLGSSDGSSDGNPDISFEVSAKSTQTQLQPQPQISPLPSPPTKKLDVILDDAERKRRKTRDPLSATWLRHTLGDVRNTNASARLYLAESDPRFRARATFTARELYAEPAVGDLVECSPEYTEPLLGVIAQLPVPFAADCHKLSGGKAAPQRQVAEQRDFRYTVILSSGAVRFVYPKDIRFRVPRLLPPRVLLHSVARETVLPGHLPVGASRLVPDAKTRLRLVANDPEEVSVGGVDENSELETRDSANLGDSGKSENSPNSDSGNSENSENSSSFFFGHTTPLYSEEFLQQDPTFVVPDVAKTFVCRPIRFVLQSAWTQVPQTVKALEVIHRALQFPDGRRKVPLLQLYGMLEDFNVSELCRAPDVFAALKSRCGTENRLGYSVYEFKSDLQAKIDFTRFYALYLALKQRSDLFVLDGEHGAAPRFVELKTLAEAQRREELVALLRDGPSGEDFTAGRGAETSWHAEFADFVARLEAYLSGMGFYDKKLWRDVAKSREIVAKFAHDSSEPHFLPLLDALHDYACGNVPDSDSELVALLAQLLRHIPQFHNRDVSRDACLSFLATLGYPPIVPPVYYNRELPVPFMGTSGRADREQECFFLWRDISESRDSVAQIREEFCGVPVYCIDDAAAHEIDDGIAVVRHSERHWEVQIHIADPASFLQPSDPEFRAAFARATTVYLPEGIVPMFPSGVTNVANMGIAGQRTRTMSFIVAFDPKEKDPNVAFRFSEARIHPGWVNNFRKLTYNEVNEFLKGNVAKSDPYVAEVAQDLADLQKVGQMFRKLRLQNGGFDFPSVQAIVRLSDPVDALDPQGAAKFRDLQSLRHRYTEQEIVAQYASQEPKVEIERIDMRGARSLVADLMILANFINAAFFVRHNIPGIFRNLEVAQSDARIKAESSSRAALAQLLEHRDAEGALPLPIFAQLRGLLRPVTAEAQPRGHAILGLAHYMHGTSPLRRFTDVVAHWQVQQFLLKREFPGSHSGVAEIFSESEIVGAADHILMQQLRATRLEKAARSFWGLREIRKLKMANPKLEFELLVTGSLQREAQPVLLVDWGLQGWLQVARDSVGRQIELEVGRSVRTGKIIDLSVAEGKIVLGI